MCCETHDLRDFMARYDGRDGALAELLAPDDMHRCRCTELGKWPGTRCERTADGEDILCPWCRATDHSEWYAVQGLEKAPGWVAYYRQYGRAGYAQAYPGGSLQGYSAMGRLRDKSGYGQAEYAPQDYRKFIEQAQSGQVTVPGTEWESGLAVSPQGLAEAEGSYSPGPYLETGRIDFRAQPFTFSTEEIAGMRAASQAGEGLAGYRLEAAGELSTEGVMRYLQRKYGMP